MKKYRFLPCFVALLASPMIVQSAGLEEIIVTAQKRAESVQDVPISVSVISGDNIETLGISSGSDIGNQVPNVQVQRPYGDIQPIFSIRGISMTDFKATQASPIGVYIDEVFLGVPFTHGMQMFDVDRIEVLRGPQGTLFGKNTTGGAISIASKKPTGEKEGYVKLGLGNFNRIDLKAAYETPLIEDKLTLRVAVNAADSDGHFKSQLEGVDDPDAVGYWAGRVSLAYQVNDDLEAVFRYTKADQDANAPTITPGGTNIGGFTHTGSKFDSYANRIDAMTSDFDIASLSINYDVGDLTFTSITAVGSGDYLNKTDADGSPLEIINIDWGTSFDQISQDLRVSGSSDRLKYIAGLYYTKEDVDGNNFYTFGADRPDPFAGISIRQDLELERESYALYGQATYELTDALALTMGLRYSVDEHTISNFSANWINSVTGAPSAVATAVFGSATTLSLAEDSFEDKEVSGKLGLDYHVNGDVLLYANYSRGYRSGAFNTGALFQPETANPLEPELVDAFEVGAKTQFWNNQAQLNASVFYYDYQDQQFINVVGLSQLLASADEASVLGAEIELLVQPTDNLRLQVGLGLLDTEYDKAELLVALDAFGATSRLQDLSGNQLVAAPEVNFNFATDYTIPMQVGEIVLHLDTVYTSEQFFSAFNDFHDPTTVGADYRNIKQESYWWTNVRTEYRNESKGYGIALWVKNLTDEEVVGYGINSQSYGGFDYTQYLRPRTYGVEFSYKF